MDENFEQLKLVITDVGNLEIQLGDKVSTSVYDAKIVDIDQSILDLENALIGTVSEEFVNQLESRITVNENHILTMGVPDWPVTLDYDAGGNLITATYANLSDRFRQQLSYDTSGVLVTVLYEQSSDSGTTWQEIGIETLNYDADGNLTSTNWLGA